MGGHAASAFLKMNLPNSLLQAKLFAVLMVTRDQLFKEWVTLSNRLIVFQWMSVKKIK